MNCEIALRFVGKSERRYERERSDWMQMRRLVERYLLAQSSVMNGAKA